MPTRSTPCPHCGESAITSLPDGKTTIENSHKTLRYPHRTTCQRCGSDFSYTVAD